MFAIGDTAEPYVLVGEHETGSLVVFLLRDNAVETDNPIFKPRHPGLPKKIAVPAPTQVRLDDIEAEKAKGWSVYYSGNAADRFTIQTSDQEAFRIGSMETRSIGETGIPALTGSPLDCEIEIIARHGSNL